MFLIYALADYWAWEANLDSKLVKSVNSEQGTFKIDDAVEEALEKQPRLLFVKSSTKRLKVLFQDYIEGRIGTRRFVFRASPIAAYRLVEDLVFPIAFGAFAIVYLLTWPGQKSGANRRIARSHLGILDYHATK